MNCKSLLILAVAICAISQISAFNFCNCKEKGVDVCNCKKTITAPRPYPIQVPRIQKPVFKSICKEQGPLPPKPFSPIGDACHCGQQIVKPAPLPAIRPNCGLQFPKFELPKPTCSCSSCANANNNNDNDDSSRPSGCGQPVRAPEEFQISARDGATIYFQSAKKPALVQRQKYAPADVVSIAIAKRIEASAKNGISEKQLQYGSWKEPVVSQKEEKKQPDVNEELFYDTKGNVLEIKPYIFKQQQDSSEEDSSEEKPKKKPTAFHSANLDFEDIGYKAYEPSKPRYVVVKNSEPVKHDCNQRQPRNQGRGEPCNCPKDLVIDQSTFSDQSMSFESSNDHFNPRFST